MSATGTISRCSRALSYEGTKPGTNEGVYRNCGKPAIWLMIDKAHDREYWLCDKHLAEMRDSGDFTIDVRPGWEI